MKDQRVYYPHKRVVLFFLFVVTFILAFFPSSAEAALEDHVYIEDQYGERWRPGEMTSANIFATILERTVDSPTADGEKLIAPGTSGYYSFTIHNDYEQPIEYIVTGRDENEQELPLDFKLRVTNGPWIKGSENAWSLWSATFPLDYKRRLAAGQSETIDLTWQWPFERDKDKNDTSFGERALKEELVYRLTLNVIVETDEEVADIKGNTQKNVTKEPVQNTLAQDSAAFFKQKLWRQYPQTGEFIAKSSIVMGILIVLFIYIVWRVRKGREKCE